MRRSGSTGKSTPANLATPAAQAPAQFTTLRVATEPRVVSTEAIPVASRVKPVTTVFFQKVAP